MKKSSEKIESAVSEKRVKLHLFEPSKRKIWTIVGRGKEHWLDPDFEFCSCPGYYFGKLEGKKQCYHMDSIKLAKKENKFEIIKFSDYEFEDFISSLVDDL
jgi:predicted nucleic acid-binding Zn finger protein